MKAIRSVNQQAIFEFSLMTYITFKESKQKSKSGIIISITSCLIMVTFPDVVVKKKFQLPHLDRFSEVNSLYPEVVMEIHFVVLPFEMYLLSDRIPPVTISFSEFVMIHWIQWNSFRENSNGELNQYGFSFGSTLSFRQHQVIFSRSSYCNHRLYRSRADYHKRNKELHLTCSFRGIHQPLYPWDKNTDSWADLWYSIGWGMATKPGRRLIKKEPTVNLRERHLDRPIILCFASWPNQVKEN